MVHMSYFYPPPMSEKTNAQPLHDKAAMTYILKKKRKKRLILNQTEAMVMDPWHGLSSLVETLDWDLWSFFFLLICIGSKFQLGAFQRPSQEVGNVNLHNSPKEQGLTCAARSEPARSIMKRRAKRTSCSTSRQRLCCLTATCSTACERDDVWLAAVGSWVRCLLPFISNSMI